MPNNYGDHKLLISDSAHSIEGTPGAPLLSWINLNPSMD